MRKTMARTKVHHSGLCWSQELTLSPGAPTAGTVLSAPQAMQSPRHFIRVHRLWKR